MTALPLRSLARELPHCVGQQVIVEGWLHRLRALGKLCFLILRDRSGFIQITLEDPQQIDLLKPLHVGSVLRVAGKVTQTEQADLGIELVQPTVEVMVPIHEPPPLDYSKPELRCDLEHLLDHRAVALRHPRLAAVFRIQSEMVQSYRRFMTERIEAVEYFPPNLINSSSEGGAELFHVDYFGYDVALAQSSQLYKQILVGVYERVFAIAPFFRAEKSHTPRHLAEGRQLEFEMGFLRDWHEILDVVEECMRAVVQGVKQRCAAELEILGSPLAALPEGVRIPRLTFAEAQELAWSLTGVDERTEPDLSPQTERVLCRWAREQHGCDFLIVTDWLSSKRPFYSCPNPEHPELSHTFDLLCNGTEVASGGERRHEFSSLEKGLRERELDPEQFGEYLSVFRYGMPRHGGFGLGLERLTMTLLGLSNIREASLFPSDPKRVAGTKLRARIVFGGEEVRNSMLHLLHHAAAEVQHEKVPASAFPLPSSTPAPRAVKALIVKGKRTNKHYLCCLPLADKLDPKALAAVVGERVEFESPEVILERYGVRVGGVPPCGRLMGIETYFDRSLESAEGTVLFSCGLPEESIVCTVEALSAIAQPQYADLAKV